MDKKETNFDYHVLYDSTFRKELIENPKAHIGKLGYELDDDVEIVVKCNTKDTCYIAIDTHLNAEEIQAAGALGTIGSVGSASTAATVTSSFSSAGSAGSVGTASTK